MTTVIYGTTGIDKVNNGSIEQADLGPNVAGNGPAFSAYKSADQTVTSGAPTLITYDTEDFDTASCFSAGRFTPNVAGYYQIDTVVGLGASSTTAVLANIRKNGADYKRIMQLNASTALLICSGSFLIYMNGSTDYLEIFATISGTGTCVVMGTALLSAFSGFLARAA